MNTYLYLEISKSIVIEYDGNVGNAKRNFYTESDNFERLLKDGEGDLSLDVKRRLSFFKVLLSKSVHCLSYYT